MASVATFGLGYLPVLLQRKAETAKSDRVLDFLRNAYVHWSLGRPIPRDLPAVTRLNALDALLRNATILRIPVQFLEADDFDSPFNSFEPSPSAGGPALPKDLCPTALQRSVTHHSWLDLFPFPGLRNNVLRGIQAGVYDEDVLCEQLCCDLLNLGADTVASVVIWGDSWDARGWEFSASFFSRSGMLLQGCPEVLETTNYWRGTRGVRRIQLPHT